jgi:hypothetical protein
MDGDAYIYKRGRRNCRFILRIPLSLGAQSLKITLLQSVLLQRLAKLFVRIAFLAGTLLAGCECDALSDCIKQSLIKLTTIEKMKKLVFSLVFTLMALALVTSTASATPVGKVPDAATTGTLLSMGVAGLAALRKFLR